MARRAPDRRPLQVWCSGHERARSNVVELSDVATLRGLREEATTAERCDLLAARFDCFALYRDPVELVAYSTGNAPGGLPRHGFKAAPGLVPFSERVLRSPVPW